VLTWTSLQKLLPQLSLTRLDQIAQGTPIMADNKSWSNFKQQIYASRKGPVPLGTVSFKEIEQKGKEALEDHIGMYRSLPEAFSKHAE
jgi:hypothetical protein